MIDTEKPKLRLVDAKPLEYEGANYLLLRDPLELSEQTLLVPEPFIPALMLSDGTRSLAGIRGALALRYGKFISTERLSEFFDKLSEACLLEDEHTSRAMEAARKSFQEAPFRPPANAGLSYPEEPKELASYLQGYIDALNGNSPSLNGSVRGIVSPHIDYERGGPVYAQVWGPAAESVRQADLAIIFGTDHFSEGHPFTLTRQNYATPFGVLPTATEIVDQLAQVLGEKAAYAGELHHRKEHSIELAAVWMHHVRGGKPVEMVPILCGSLEACEKQMDGKLLDAFLDVLQKAIQGRRVVIVAAGDLAHVGPAFGGEPVDPGKLIVLKNADDELIQTMLSGDAEGFQSAIQKVNDVNNVCGVSPIYLTLRLLGKTSGQNLGYAVCPADDRGTSVVTICGVTLQ